MQFRYSRGCNFAPRRGNKKKRERSQAGPTPKVRVLINVNIQQQQKGEKSKNEEDDRRCSIAPEEGSLAAGVAGIALAVDGELIGGSGAKNGSSGGEIGSGQVFAGKRVVGCGGQRWLSDGWGSPRCRARRLEGLEAAGRRRRRRIEAGFGRRVVAGSASLCCFFL